MHNQYYYSTVGTLEKFTEKDNYIFEVAEERVKKPKKITMVLNDATIHKNHTWEFGNALEDKEINAGKIGYQFMDNSSGLDIVGAGPEQDKRLINMWDNVDVYGRIRAKEIGSMNEKEGVTINNGLTVKNGNITLENGNLKMRSGDFNARNIYSDNTVSAKNVQVGEQLCFGINCFDAEFLLAPPPKGERGDPGPPGKPGPSEIKGNNAFEFGSGIADKVDNAGKMGYKFMNNSESLDIVGAGDSANKRRKVRVWDDLKTDRILLGEKFVLSGVGDNHANDEWLRLFGQHPDGSLAYRSKEWYNGTNIPEYNHPLKLSGFAAGKMWSSDGVMQASDIRLKENIKDIDDKELLKLDQIKPVTYKMKAEPNGPNKFGFIAQDVEKLYPNVVTEGPNKLKSIDYQAFIPLITKKLNKIHPEPDKLCIGNTCITEKQLKDVISILNNNNK